MNGAPESNPEMQHSTDPARIGEVLPEVMDAITEQALAIRRQVDELLDEQRVLIQQVREGGRESVPAYVRLGEVNELLLKSIHDDFDTDDNDVK